MANTSISGLVSGLDTSTIISQLMQLEARPQTMLKSKVSNEQKIITALQAFNTKLAAIATKAAGLAATTGWATTKAASDIDSVTVATSAGASPGTLAFTVGSLAAAASETYAKTGASGDAVMGADLSYRITYNDGRTAETFNTGTGKLTDVAAAINAKTGVSATMVMVGSGATPTYELRVESTATGASSGFTITQFDPASPTTPVASPVPFMGDPVAAKTVQGADAAVTIAGQTNPLTFSGNTISGLMPGVDVTLGAGAVGKSATITVERDTASVVESVKAMVESVNAALTEIGTLTAYDATTRKSGLLGGDSTLRTVRNQLLESVSRGVVTSSGTESLATLGIQVDRSGKLVFDEAKFKAAYTADPTGTTNKIAGTTDAAGNPVIIGLADKLKTLGEAFSSSSTGTISKSIQSRQSAIRGWEDDIADWDIRLAARQTTLQRQYTALESALGKLQSQGSWLAGQIASLPQMSSGS